MHHILYDDEDISDSISNNSTFNLSEAEEEKDLSIEKIYYVNKLLIDAIENETCKMQTLEEAEIIVIIKKRIKI